MKHSDWGPSGDGSSAAVTRPLRELLRILFHDEKMKIKSFFDAPCGDWVWMQSVDLSRVTYVGGDITPYTIQENKRCFARDNVNFTVFDLTCNKIPEVDLMLTRDVLFHQHPDTCLKILNAVSKSKVRYFLSTTFMTLNSENQFDSTVSYNEINRVKGKNTSIGYHDINLFDAPYCLPKPLLKVRDLGQERSPRYVALWKLPFKVGQCDEVKKLGKDAWKDF